MNAAPLPRFTHMARLALLLLATMLLGLPAIGAAVQSAGPIRIDEVVVARPYCRPNQPSSNFLLRGAGFDPAHNFQFLNLDTGQASIHLHNGSTWLSAGEVVLNMEVMRRSLWPQPGTRAAVRITSGSYQALSDWSPAFRLDMQAMDCNVPLVRGQAGDLWADMIVGQPNFTEISPFNVVGHKLFNPGGVVVDRSVTPGRLYVWDSGNSRILGIDLALCPQDPASCQPQVVLGQPGMVEASGCNRDSFFQTYPVRPAASAATLCGVPETTISPLEHKSFVTMDVDASGNLYVPDVYNNRVLKYSSPFTTDALADQVWGQANFVDSDCNRSAQPGARPTAASLCFHHEATLSSALDIDPAGNLWVSDSGNHRVLRFPKDLTSGQIAATADLVLGQSDFTSYSSGVGMGNLFGPSGVLVAGDGKAYVIDHRNRRILVYAPPFSNGMAATSTFGSGFTLPTALQLDPHNAGVWVSDMGNTMLELWGWDGSVKNVIGKDVYSPGPSSQSLFVASGGGLGVDTEGHLFVSRYGQAQDVLRFALPLPAPQSGTLHQPDAYLFAEPGGYNLMSDASMVSPRGVAIYEDQLIVADGERLMFWNDRRALTSGQPADGIVGRASYAPFRGHNYGRIKVDAAGHLWVLRDPGGVLVFQLPLENQELQHAIPIPYRQTLPLLGGGQITLGGRFDGLAPSPDGLALWLSDTLNSRVVRIRNPLTQPVVDVVLGQQAATSTSCNQGLAEAPIRPGNEAISPVVLCYPGAVALDRFGNVFVSDHALETAGNWRLLEFDAATVPLTLASALFAPAATKIFPYDNIQPAMTFEVAFDSQNRMVAGYNSYLAGRFVGFYPDPLGLETNPDLFLHDYGSMAYSMVFDDDDNLYVTDFNRGRVLVYRQPFVEQPPAPTPTPTAPTATSSATSTALPSATSTSTPTLPAPSRRRIMLPLLRLEAAS